MIPGAILAQMRDVVTVNVSTGTDGYGNPVLTKLAVVRARVTFNDSRRSSATGDDSATNFTVLMEDVADFNDACTLTIEGASYPVKSFTRPAWPDGGRHLRVVV